jgi:hypothetical protein
VRDFILSGNNTATDVITIIFNSSATDPLVHYGRHFGRTVYALCNFQALLTNGILWMGELADTPEENFTAEYFTFPQSCVQPI